mgnify:CR=1 FL=1
MCPTLKHNPDFRKDIIILTVYMIVFGGCWHESRRLDLRDFSASDMTVRLLLLLVLCTAGTGSKPDKSADLSVVNVRINNVKASVHGQGVNAQSNSYGNWMAHLKLLQDLIIKGWAFHLKFCDSYLVWVGLSLVEKKYLVQNFPPRTPRHCSDTKTPKP